MMGRVRAHFVSHWRVWLAIAVVVVVVNEIVDRNFFDHRQHIAGDVALTVVIVAAAFVGSYLAVRIRGRKGADRPAGDSAEFRRQ